jgi:tyrosine-protein phosphatase YwqE
MALFNLFHKKYTARPIFAALGTDMHCHLIPAVDDGSKCTEESIECLQTLQEVGYKKVYITPHFQHPRFPNDEDDIVRRYNELKQQAQAAGITIEMAGIGGEYRIDSGFRPRLDNPRFLKVADKYVLVEFSLHQQMMGCDELIFDMQMKGYEIILAHPERYPYLNIDGARMEQLLNQGVYLQVNVLSLGGFYGDEAKKRAFAIIERGWVSFLGTDTHNSLYCQALRDVSCNRKVEKILEKYTFMNNTL